MLVVAKTHHINVEITGEGVEELISILKKEIPDIVVESDKDYVKISETDWYKDMKKNWNPGITLKIRRENAGLTQNELSKKTGISVSNISAMEHGKRKIGASTAKKLAEALDTEIIDFLQ